MDELAKAFEVLDKVGENIFVLREALIELTHTRKYESRGICGNLNRFNYTYIVGDLAISWPKFSGKEEFPIPGDIEGYYHHTRYGTLWTGEQLKLRIELINFILDIIDAYISTKYPIKYALLDQRTSYTED